MTGMVTGTVTGTVIVVGGLSLFYVIRQIIGGGA